MTKAKPATVPKWLRVKVTREDIANAIMAKSTGCAISDAVARTYPDAERPVSDIRSVKVTFPETGERAEYKMSLAGAQFIVQFDKGVPDLDGFSLRLPLVAHRPVRVQAGHQRTAADRHAARQLKLDQGEELTPAERTAEKNYKGLPRPTTVGRATYTDGPEGAIQTGGMLSPVSPGASGPTVFAPNQWAESGPTRKRGKRPQHYRGFGVHGLGDFDPAVLETAGQVYNDQDTEPAPRG